MGWKPETLEGHAMLSDAKSAALVYEDGTIDWLCLPRFDSAPCLAALLGDDENGGWWLRPSDEILSRTRAYLGESMILETVYRTRKGEVAVIDFMPLKREQAPDIVRIVEGRRGRVELISRLAPRFDGGRTHPLTVSASDGEIVAIAGPNGLALRFDTPIETGPRAYESRFCVEAGERKALTMTWFNSVDPVPDRLDIDKAFSETMRYWREWSRISDYNGKGAPYVKRSLLILKGLFDETSGGMVAASTTSLPERWAGDCNWDYRYCWLRDATFTLLAFMKTGHIKEAQRWIGWLRRALAGDPVHVQPFYTVDGNRQVIEWEAGWLAGFRGSQPVRFGNRAVDQLQLDIYGEVIDTLFVARNEGLIEDASELTCRLVEDLEHLWEKPDAGIWESRHSPKHHVYSKAMCWVAFDRAARMTEGDPAQTTVSRRWRALADRIRTEVFEKGYNHSIGAFTQHYGGTGLDSAVLRLPLVGFIDASDDKMVTTVAAIEKTLLRENYVYRLCDGVKDGLKTEGAFLAIGCWLADVYVLQGRTGDARRLFDATIATANDLGLLSEEYDVENRRAMGNFPQALSHIALVNTALTLDSGKPPRLVT